MVCVSDENLPLEWRMVVDPRKAPGQRPVWPILQATVPQNVKRKQKHTTKTFGKNGHSLSKPHLAESGIVCGVLGNA